MTQLTSDQAREIRDVFQTAADNLNKYGRKNINSLSVEEINDLFTLVRDLLNYSSMFNAIAIRAQAEELENAIEKVKDATKEANNAIKKLKKVRDAIKIGTALVSLGTAIAAGNPGGIFKAAAEVFGAAQAATT